MVLCESLCNGSDLYTGSAVPFTTILCYKLAHCQLAVICILATATALLCTHLQWFFRLA